MADKIDWCIAKALHAEACFSKLEYSKAADFYLESSNGLKSLLDSGAIRDPNSRRFVLEKYREFLQLVSTSKRKADQADEAQLRERFMKLKSGQKSAEDEDSLRQRFEALEGRRVAGGMAEPNTNLKSDTEADLVDRMAKLGPSQFAASGIENNDDELLRKVLADEFGDTLCEKENSTADSVDAKVDQLFAQAEKKLGIDSFDNVLHRLDQFSKNQSQANEVEELLSYTKDYIRFSPKARQGSASRSDKSTSSSDSPLSSSDKNSNSSSDSE